MDISPSIAVQDWVRRNGEIFRTPPRGMDLSKTSRIQTMFSEAGMAEPVLDIIGCVAAVVRVVMSSEGEDGQGSIDPPPCLPPSSYYKDVRNHANIAASMLVTARHQVGFEPSLVGQELSPQKMDDVVYKFYKWVGELDNYWPYIEMKARQSMVVLHGGDQNRINEVVSKFVASFGGLNEEVEEGWREAVRGMVKGIRACVNEHGASVSTIALQMNILDTSGHMDPIQPLTFGRTVQSEPPYGKYDSVLITGTTYLIHSSAIIAAADDFAKHGVTIF